MTTRYLYTAYSGPALLETPLLNKGSAFNEKERKVFNLMGLLPTRYETIEEQVERAYMQYSSFTDPLNKHIYLRNIQDTNETLFFKLLQRHIEEMMPIIYTPTVGDACEKFSDIYRSSRGLFISYKERHNLDDILRNVTKPKVKVIVVTDGERILGLGDQGIGGMGIPIGKLSLYTACGGISPAYTLPITLDVGTNNQKLLDDPMYMGARHERIAQDQYNEFIQLFMEAVKHRWPESMVQFEDFAQPNAMPILNKYRNTYCCFNDDIQGTAAVALGTLLAACRMTNKKLSDMRVAFVGGGSAGCGIAAMLIQQMRHEGMSESDARKRIYMLDRLGLITAGQTGLRDFQAKLAQQPEDINHWAIAGDYASLYEVVEHAKPDILIGVSGVPGLFTQEVIELMAKNHELPIIFPLSNPSRQVEAHPLDVIKWTGGKVIIATGSPFGDVMYQGQAFHVAQCNNSYIFPGIGLGVIVSKARIISDEMIMASSNTLAEVSPLANNGEGGLLPPLTQITELSKSIAFNVAKVAMQQGYALKVSDEELKSRIDKYFWAPEYREYKRSSV
ncbi:MAG: NAD-dependent malic enzyme [Glaciecola sp. HTCC2999]|jgi:malate dehydrogenase (oxaloacetate-decarboxylating)|nr:MAG: NAD-dependent malic enzyme [Glaciecola sp. HTCC2999]